MHSPNTIKGVLEFCAREGQPTSTLENFLESLSKFYRNNIELADLIDKELQYEESIY